MYITPVYLLKGLQTSASQRHWNINLYWKLTIDKLCKQAGCATGEHIEEMWCSAHSGVLFSHTEEWTYAICRETFAAEDHHIKQIKLIKQIISPRMPQREGKWARKGPVGATGLGG